jgi:hypothetical protein
MNGPASTINSSRARYLGKISDLESTANKIKCVDGKAPGR